MQNHVDHAADAFFLHDDRLFVVDVNRQACESLGYSREELIGMLPREFDVGLDEASAARIAERVGAGETVTFESLHRRKDGTVFPVEVRAFRFQQGERRFRLSLVRDITERRRAEEGLLELKERFRALAESSLVGIYLILENRFRYVNPAMARMFGYTVEELVERLGPPDLVHPDDRALVAENIRRRVEGDIEEVRYEFRGLRKNGSVFPVEVHGRRIELGGRTGVMGALLDNTERRRAEHELRRSQSYLAEAQRLSHTGSFGWNSSNGELHWSEETYRIFDLDPATPTTIGRVLERTHPDDRAAVLAAIRLARRDGTDFELEHRLLMPDGSMKHLRVVAHAVTDAHQRVFVGAVMDVTLQKRAEEERRAHVWFLESMERVNRAIQGTDDLERMIGDVLDVVLAIFECERVSLLTELGAPEVTSFRVAALRARPGCAGDLLPGVEYPADEDLRAILRASRAGLSPVQFTPGSEPPLAARVVERFGVRSMLAVPLHPQLDEPGRFHQLALAQCSYARIWAPHEVRLFHEICRRLGDAVSTLSLLRDLRQSEARLEEAQRLAHVGHWEWDLTTDRFTCSDETSAILGLRPEERPTTWARFTDRIHPEDRHLGQRAIEEVRASGSRAELEYRVLRPSGEPRVVHVRGSISRDDAGTPRRMFGTIQDVTERKRADEELRASESRFRSLVDFAADAFMLHDQDGTVVDVNRQACESLGYSREELIGMTPGEFDADFDQAALQRINEGLAAGQILTFETHHRRKDGSVFPVEVRVRQVKQGGRWFNISLSRDITASKRAEQERERLRQAQADLARISRVTTMGELTASLAHEVKQPIAAAITNSNACVRWLSRDRPDLEEAREAAARIVQDATRAAQIIDRVRSLYKKDAPRRDRVDVNATIRETLALLRGEVARHSISIRCDLTTGLPTVAGDRVQLQQVLVNLMLNGIEAMSETPGELTIESKRGPGGELLIIVSDEGVGLPEGSADAMFDAFFTTKPQGTGMGLTISRSIVEAHGGRLWATRRAGRGATFHIALPPAELAADGARLAP